MAVALAEAHDFVLDGRAIARPPALDLARVHRRAVHVGPDDVMGRRHGAGDRALDLPVADTVRQHRERFRRLVPRLHLQHGPVDGGPVETRRRASLQAPEHDARAFERSRQPERRRFANAPGRDLPLADMDEAAEKRAGRQDHCRRVKDASVAEPDTSHLPAAQKIVHLAFDNRQICSLPDRALHGRGIKLAVSLSPRPTDRRAFAAIENAELDAGAIGHPAHQAIQRIDFADQMAFAEPADGGIARHRADCRKPLRDQRRLGAHPCGGSGCLTASVAAANDNHIEAAVHHDPPNDARPSTEATRKRPLADRRFT